MNNWKISLSTILLVFAIIIIIALSSCVFILYKENKKMSEISNNEGKFFEKSYTGVTVNGPLYKFYEDGKVSYFESELFSKEGTYTINSDNEIVINFTKKIENTPKNEFDWESVTTEINETKIFYYLPDNNNRIISESSTSPSIDYNDNNYVFIENLVVY